MSVLVERDNIGIFGRMNAGKSSIMNLIAQQTTSIVDPAPGTTADTAVSLHEVHGIGPVRIFDTAGVDETGRLGEKKRKRALSDLKECDLVLLVIDPSKDEFSPEQELLEQARELDKQVIAVFNIFHPGHESLIKNAETNIPLLRFHPRIILRANDEKYRKPLVDFILTHYDTVDSSTEILPFIKRDEFYILVIPMDIETPSGRYLRPQAMTEEYITRNWAYPVSFRLDLGSARGGAEEHEKERQRFERLVSGLGKKPHCIITDSQAMDIMKDWCPDDVSLTTFSIVMIQYMSGGRLSSFVRGISTLDELKKGDSVLISEACNHTRIEEDIGTVQIPKIINERFPGVIVEHAFGMEFQKKTGLEKYSLIIHCGGCMISRQKMSARIRDLDAVGAPYTNYGIFLSAVQGRAALEKVLGPWGISVTL